MLGKLVRFGVVGGAMTLLNYAIFTGGIGIGAGYLPAASIAWIVTLTASYLLNRSFTFRARNHPSPGEFAVFFGGCILQLLFGLCDYALLIGRMGLSPTLAFVINTGLTVLFSFTFMRVAVFAPRLSRAHLGAAT